MVELLFDVQAQTSRSKLTCEMAAMNRSCDSTPSGLISWLNAYFSAESGMELELWLTRSLYTMAMSNCCPWSNWPNRLGNSPKRWSSSADRETPQKWMGLGPATNSTGNWSNLCRKSESKKSKRSDRSWAGNGSVSRLRDSCWRAKKDADFELRWERRPSDESVFLSKTRN